MKTIRISRPFSRSEVLAIPGIITLRASHDTNAARTEMSKDRAVYGVIVCADGDQASIQLAIDAISTPALQGSAPSSSKRDLALAKMEKL